MWSFPCTGAGFSVVGVQQKHNRHFHCCFQDKFSTHTCSFDTIHFVAFAPVPKQFFSQKNCKEMMTFHLQSVPCWHRNSNMANCSDPLVQRQRGQNVFVVFLVCLNGSNSPMVQQVCGSPEVHRCKACADAWSKSTQKVVLHTSKPHMHF